MSEEGYIKRAPQDKLKEIFNKHATIQKDGERFMSPNDFVKAYLQLGKDTHIGEEAVRLLASTVDNSKTGQISYHDFREFEGLLCYPDALYKILFRLFDLGKHGVLSHSDFVEVLKKTDLYHKVSLNTSSHFMERYFGKGQEKSIPYHDFGQFLHDFRLQCAIEAFEQAGSGSISASDFEHIMNTSHKHLLSKEVQSHVSEISRHEKKNISFPYFMAFHSLISNTDVARNVYLHASCGNKLKSVSELDFLKSSQAVSQMSPLQVHVLFELSEILHGKKNVSYSDINSIAAPNYYDGVSSVMGECTSSGGGVLAIFTHILYRFGLGFAAGGTGAAAVFPIDLVKTRIQNQRVVPGQPKMYNGYVDCFYKIIKFEGFFGLYKGLVPQLCGVSPEKAVKLTVNDFVRDKFYDEHGNIPYPAELLAGGIAGLSQVAVTNPLEIIKIRLQTAGEVKGGHKIKAREVIRNIINESGIFGLYRGIKACVPRDVTFASIYFSTYGRSKKYFADSEGHNSMLSLLLAGTVSGVPAAGLATPFDVIKTRLQVIPRPGQQTYNGFFDAVTKIYKEEGLKAFTKGALGRICRSSPQLGITLFTYELLQRYLPANFGGGSCSVKGPSQPDHIGGYSVAVPVFAGIETKFGIALPKFQPIKTE